MVRCLLPALVALTCLASAGRIQAATPAAGGGCPERRPQTGDLGIGMLQCVGGECAVNTLRRGEYVHEFSTEPRVWHLRAGSPAGEALREGDTILAVEGALVTTSEGGRRLANLRSGVPVHLRVRRDGRELTVSLLPVPGCNMPKLVVSAGRSAGPPESP